jgi:pimeloyl-ACP methyl ester carboxylesterase
MIPRRHRLPFRILNWKGFPLHCFWQLTMKDHGSLRSPRGRGRSGRGEGKTRGERSKQHQKDNSNSQTPTQTDRFEGGQTMLLLHGSRQTGQLLLGRVDKLRKALLKEEGLNLQLAAPDGPYDHPEDTNLRQWWDHRNNTYLGLETSIQMLQDLWDGEKGRCVGIMGFSQGARLAQLIALLHQTAKSQGLTKVPFEGLRFVIIVAGYDRPIPDNWNKTLEACGCRMSDSSNTRSSGKIDIPSLHIWGASDPLIPATDSQANMKSFKDPAHHEHDGGHHVPMKAQSIKAYIDFLNQMYNSEATTEVGTFENASSPLSATIEPKPVPAIVPKQIEVSPEPDEETAQAQLDEVEALTAIYPGEVTIMSKVSRNFETGENSYKHPISYHIDLKPEEGTPPGTGHWPKHPISLGVTYPYNYPSDEASPKFKLIHENNVMEFPSAKAAACMQAIDEAATAERGMPCVLSCF